MSQKLSQKLQNICFKNCLKNFSKTGIRQLQKGSAIRCQSHCPLVKSIKLPHVVSKMVKFVSKIVKFVSKTVSRNSLKNCLKLRRATVRVPKVQLISKCLFGIFNSPKKRTKNSTLLLWYPKSNCFRSFFVRIEDTKKAFRN